VAVLFVLYASSHLGKYAAGGGDAVEVAHVTCSLKVQIARRGEPGQDRRHRGSIACKLWNRQDGLACLLGCLVVRKLHAAIWPFPRHYAQGTGLRYIHYLCSICLLAEYLRLSNLIYDGVDRYFVSSGQVIKHAPNVLGKERDTSADQSAMTFRSSDVTIAIFHAKAPNFSPPAPRPC